MDAKDIIFGKGNPWGLFINYHQWLNNFMHKHNVPKNRPFVYEMKGKRYLTDAEYIVSVLHRLPKEMHLEVKKQLERVEESGQDIIDFLQNIGARLCGAGALDKDQDAVIKKIIRK